MVTSKGVIEDVAAGFPTFEHGTSPSMLMTVMVTRRMLLTGNKESLSHHNGLEFVLMKEVRPMGAYACVRGIDLRSGRLRRLVCPCCDEPRKCFFSEKGYGKQTPIIPTGCRLAAARVLSHEDD